MHRLNRQTIFSMHIVKLKYIPTNINKSLYSVYNILLDFHDDHMECTNLVPCCMKITI